MTQPNVDISAELGGLIADGKVTGSSDNIRHGVYHFIIETIRADLVDVEKGNKHKFVFWELEPLKADPNPQVEGDRVDYVSPTQVGSGPLKDDGTRPNMVGSKCALKVDFDGAGARNAPGNAQAPILALFNVQPGQMSKEQLAATWVDLSRMQPVHKGEMVGFDPNTKQPILADKDKGAQPARGMIIGCRTTAKKKKEPNEKGAWITKLNWFCVAPIGTGVNSKEEVAKRRAVIEMNIAAQKDDEEDSQGVANGQTQLPGAGAPSLPLPPNGNVAASPMPGAAAPTPPMPQMPTPPVPQPWAPTAPWRPHNDPAFFGTTPETRWYWDGGTQLKTEAQLRAGQ
jgi:hypothetical protein